MRRDQAEALRQASKAISSGFVWRDTPEGQTFWLDVCRRLDEIAVSAVGDVSVDNGKDALSAELAALKETITKLESANQRLRSKLLIADFISVAR